MLLMVVILLTYLFLGWIPLFQAFGQTFITDDYFLAVVGSLAAVCNGAGRIMWGALADRYCFKVGTSKTPYFMNNKSLFKMVCLLHGIVSNRVGARWSTVFRLLTSIRILDAYKCCFYWLIQISLILLVEWNSEYLKYHWDYRRTVYRPTTQFSLWKNALVTFL